MADVKQFIFFDFEMLCSDRGMPFSEMEAIRLGAVKYDLLTEKVSFFNKYIHPTELKPLHPFCKNLTGIEDSDLTHAKKFNEVFEEFLSWIGGVKRSRFFSWSTSDLSRLKIDAEKHDIPLTTIKKIEKRYVDFQGIFTRRVSNTNYSVENALDLYGLKFIGDTHNPMYDAYNTLRIYLNFQNKREQSDLIMLQQFIFEEKPLNHDYLNAELNSHLKNDVNLFLEQLNEIYRMKDVQKIIKRTRKIVRKYENVLVNRSGLFSQENVYQVGLLVDFYHELLLTYEEHNKYFSKIMILDESAVLPLNQLKLKEA